MTSKMVLDHPRRQRGLSFFSLIFALALFGFVLLLGFRVFPSIIENRAIDAVIQKAVTDGHNPAEIRASFDRGADTSYIDSISGKDLQIEPGPGNTFLVTYAYTKKIPLFGPVSLVIDYAGGNTTK